MVQPLRLDMRHYETVVAVIDHGSMTEAARQLSLTQSALSHRLGEAERRLGVKLFSRGPDRRLTPTTSGVALHQAASRALSELARLEDGLIGRPAGVKATVRIGVGGYQVFHWYPSFLLSMRDVHPEVELDLVDVGDDPGPALAEREVDLVLAPGEPSGGHQLRPAIADELVLICAPEHPLARRDCIEPRDLSDQTYLTYNADPSPGFEYDRFVRPAGEFPRIVRVVRQPSAIVELVAAGVGVSILSRWATAPHVETGRIAALRCGADGLPITWNIANREGNDVAAAVGQELAHHLDAQP